MQQEQIERIDKVLQAHQKDLNRHFSGDIVSRIEEVLREYKSTTQHSVYKAKELMEDVKTHFKALELVVEGITSEGLNHGQKRVIANHVITMLRSAIDRIDQKEFGFNDSVFDRFNFFRSETPEKRLMEERRELKSKVDQADKMLSLLKEKHPDVWKELENDIPF